MYGESLRVRGTVGKEGTRYRWGALWPSCKVKTKNRCALALPEGSPKCNFREIYQLQVMWDSILTGQASTMATVYMNQQTDMFLSGRFWLVLASKWTLLVSWAWPKLAAFTIWGANIWNLPICFETMAMVQEKFQTTVKKKTGSHNDM